MGGGLGCKTNFYPINWLQMFKVDLPYTRKAFFQDFFFLLGKGKHKISAKLKLCRGIGQINHLCVVLWRVLWERKQRTLQLIQVGIDIDTNLIPFRLYLDVLKYNFNPVG